MIIRRKKGIAIIGNGCAAAECIKKLREKGYSGEIHLFSDNDRPIANPMLTTYFVSGKIDWEGLFPYGKGDEFYHNYQVITHFGSPVVNLDAHNRIIKNKDGFEFSYDQCLIATGASPFLPSIPGIHSNKVFVMRTVDDAVRLKKALQNRPHKALVVGASMAGIKVVEAFHMVGVKVILADLADHIFPLAAHPDCAHIIEKRLLEKGIDLKFGAAITAIEETSGGLKAYFAGNIEPVEADLLVMCIGVRANTGFLDRKQVEIKQGVLVDQQMRTNVPGLFAAGDVAQGRNLLSNEGQIMGLWANARYQGRTAGANMAGVPEFFPGNIPHNITHFLGMDFIGIGDVKQFTRMEKKYDGKRFIQLFWQGDILTGANFLDDYQSSGIIKNQILKNLQVSYKTSQSSLPFIQNLLIRNIFEEVEKCERA